ncbi:MAG: HAD family phosphatase [Acholeplasmataceae bacterium]|nr:HAD family phosphatase [Acholeplasmataceae bacterium]
MKYLIACDLDGSLLNSRGEITKKTIKVLTMLKDQGHKVVLATGRPFSGAYPKYEELNLDTPLITDNGGSIQNPTDSSFAKQKTYIPLDMMHQLFTFSKPYLASAFFSVDDTVYAYRYDERLQGFFSGTRARNIIQKDFDQLTVEPTGIVFLVFVDHQALFEGYIEAHLRQTLSYRQWGTDRKYAIYEVYLRHISKSSAIKYLLDHYGMTYNQVIAFGDGVNDVEMIRDAHLGIAMKNGMDDVKRVAKDITEFTNDEDGIAKYLVKFFDLKLK